MSKKIDVRLTMEEIKTLMDALSEQRKDYFSPLFDKLDEIYDMNLEPTGEMTELDYLEKIGKV